MAHRWVEALQDAQAFPYPIDDPKRFYGFGDQVTEQQNALERINKTINTINNHKLLIDRTLTRVDDQDTLNYLHNIFEIYHGLLDQQTHPFYITAPDNVRKALADLNLDVHRCEGSYRTPDPRVVLTYYGLPKTRLYTDDDFDLITNDYTFGTVYLNYAEVGKVLEDFYTDNDTYIAEGAFQPLTHFSADFTVKFFDAKNAHTRMLDIIEYGAKNGFDITSKQLRPGLIPVATLDSDLSESEILSKIKESQEVTDVTLLLV